MRQIKVTTECKTKDNVTVSVTTAVQFHIDKERIEDAVFKVEQPEEQIKTAVNNIVRSSVPELDLDSAYANKNTLRVQLLSSVRPKMDAVGYKIYNILITDLRPDRTVLDSMNQINASQRHREAAIEQGEAHKVLMVKKAEGEAESKFLNGQGMARMRVEIAKGFKQSMDSMVAGGLSVQEAMNVMVSTQYVDVLKDFATHDSNTAIMVPTPAK